MKTPEEVHKFLNDEFLKIGLYPSVRGFALFMLDNRNFFHLVKTQMDLLEPKEFNDKLDE